MTIDIASAILVTIVGVLHIIFAIFEWFFWPIFAERVVGFHDHEITLTRNLGKNQAIYNLGTAVGLIWSVFSGYKPTAIMLLICVIVYGIVGAATVKFSIILTQSLPALVALIVVIVSMD